MGCQRRVIPGKVDPSVWRSEKNVSKGSVWHIKDVLDIITHIAHCRCNAPKSYAKLPLHFTNPSISVTNNSSSATASIIAETPQVIDVDSPGVEERPEAPKMLVTACKAAEKAIFSSFQMENHHIPLILSLCMIRSYFRGTTWYEMGRWCFFRHTALVLPLE